MEHLLARDLGYTVGELNERLTPGEFTRWVAFYHWEAGEKRKAAKAGNSSGGRRRK